MISHMRITYRLYFTNSVFQMDNNSIFGNLIILYMICANYISCIKWHITTQKREFSVSFLYKFEVRLAADMYTHIRDTASYFFPNGEAMSVM